MAVRNFHFARNRNRLSCCGSIAFSPLSKQADVAIIMQSRPELGHFTMHLFFPIDLAIRERRDKRWEGQAK